MPELQILVIQFSSTSSRAAFPKQQATSGPRPPPAKGPLLPARPLLLRLVDSSHLLSGTTTGGKLSTTSSPAAWALARSNGSELELERAAPAPHPQHLPL